MPSASSISLHKSFPVVALCVDIFYVCGIYELEGIPTRTHTMFVCTNSNNFWNATKKKPFYVPNFQTYEGFFHGLSVAVFSNILLFSFSFFKLWKIESWA